jgi:hypothetical protein
MEQIVNHHPYKPLNSDGSEIRLLQLLPRKPLRRKIRGRLIHVRLDDMPVYDALSYTWGEITNPCTITLDNNEGFAVTRNAYFALEDLRPKHGILPLWIDAICINQHDVKERNHQVALMRRIYQQASRVRIWLDYTLDEQSFLRLHSITRETSAADLGDDPDVWKPVAGIGELPYWKRVWIQQELAFAKEIVLHCRKTSFDGQIFGRLKELLQERRFDSEHRLNLDWGSVQCLYVNLTTGEHGARYETLLEALANNRHLKATDGRDRVYALLSLAKDVDIMTYRIAYEKTVEEVYTDAVLYILHTSQSLAFLCAANPKIPDSALKLPSWLPDWSVSDLEQPNGVYIFPKGVAEGPESVNTTLPTRVLDDGKTLLVSGMGIALVSRVYKHPIWRTVEKPMSYLEDWADILDLDLTGIVNEEPSAETFGLLEARTDALPTAKWDALLRTLLHHLAEYDPELVIHLRNELVTIFPRALELYLAGASDESGLRRVLSKSEYDSWVELKNSIILGTIGKFIIAFEDGRLALGPTNTQPGDRAFYVKDCPMFMLLRPAQDSHHEVVGPIIVARLTGQCPAEMIRWMGVGIVLEEIRLI